MFKRIIIFLSISFIIFFISLYFYHLKEREFNNYIAQIENISSEIEKKELNEIDNIQSNTWDKNELNEKKLIEEMIANNLSDVDSIININNQKNINSKTLRYKKLYISSMDKKNNELAIKAIKNLLKETDHKEIWYKKLIDLYVQIWNFKLAEEYSKKLLEIQWNKENLKDYFYVKLQNINFFSNEQVEDIRSLVNSLYKKKVVTSWEFTFYIFLIDLLSKWELENLDNNLKALIQDAKISQHKNLLLSIQNSYEKYKKSKWSPLYYFKTLLALDLLKFWYFWLSKNIAENVYIQDSSYTLAQQILWYSYFYMWNYENAIKYFKILKKQNNGDEDDYNFFLWISYYWIQKPKDTLLYLSQLTNTYPYYKDVLRYTLLSYIDIKETWNVKKTISKLSSYELSYIDYYNIFKYLLFECDKCYKTELKTLLSLIRSCYKQVSKDNEYVCWYGKWNLFLKAWKQEFAIKYLKLLSEYFQDTYIFHNLATYYENNWDLESARKYYLKELLYTENSSRRKVLEQKIQQLYINK